MSHHLRALHFQSALNITNTNEVFLLLLHKLSYLYVPVILFRLIHGGSDSFTTAVEPQGVDYSHEGRP